MRRRNVKILLTGTASDSHTWNLVYLQLLLEELGHPVGNLGPCVTDELLTAACAAEEPGLVVISSVNGHGYRDGLSAVRAVRRAGLTLPVVIGGKLGVAGAADPEQRARLLDAGCDAVFDDGDVTALKAFLATLGTTARTGRHIVPRATSQVTSRAVAPRAAQAAARQGAARRAVA
ncbi:cobalamin B12-binding domain-containing protein [Streptomyces sp. NPDC059957]|uniref:cobalamin B12-binding domain-containing protein n=1 Tax=unclassified Streptomyces TaxID=2593676 RepID=UPI00364B60ED